MRRPLEHSTALRLTVNAFYDAAIREIIRLRREKNRALRNKRLKGNECRLHLSLVRWLLVQRRREQGFTYAAIGTEIGVTKQRVRAIWLSPEPKEKRAERRRIFMHGI